MINEFGINNIDENKRQEINQRIINEFQSFVFAGNNIRERYLENVGEYDGNIVEDYANSQEFMAEISILEESIEDGTYLLSYLIAHGYNADGKKPTTKEEVKLYMFSLINKEWNTYKTEKKR